MLCITWKFPVVPDALLKATTSVCVSAIFYLESNTQLCLVLLYQRKGRRTVKVMFHFINLFILD